MKNNHVITAGLALFSMFFGAGDLIWPLILGGETGQHSMLAVLGFVITGSSLPLIGLIAVMLFRGNLTEFFSRLGRFFGPVTVLIVMCILGPFGSLPRLFTLAHASLMPYIPKMSLLLFSCFAALLVFAFTIKKRRIVEILGLYLTPIFLLSIGSIVVLGLIYAPDAHTVALTANSAFGKGLIYGYNTLDLIAAFVFAPVVMNHFVTKEEDPKKHLKTMVQASFLACLLLSILFVSLAWISSRYTSILGTGHKPEALLTLISLHLLGPYGGFISCFSVALACLTTAIPVSSICADYIGENFLKKKAETAIPLAFVLSLSVGIASLGFSAIAEILAPILAILYPGLIVLSLMNIFYKLYELKMTKAPVYATFALSTLGYLFHFFRLI